MPIENILDDIDHIQKSINGKVNKRFNFDQTRQMLERMNEFEDCEQCGKYVELTANVVKDIGNSKPDAHRSRYNTIIKQTLTHLRKNHDLVTKGYYTTMYMSLGIALGLAVGVAFSQFMDQSAYTGIGLPVGLAIGLAVGSGKDTKAREENRVI